MTASQPLSRPSQECRPMLLLEVLSSKAIHYGTFQSSEYRLVHMRQLNTVLGNVQEITVFIFQSYNTKTDPNLNTNPNLTNHNCNQTQRHLPMAGCIYNSAAVEVCTGQAAHRPSPARPIWAGLGPGIFTFETGRAEISSGRAWKCRPVAAMTSLRSVILSSQVSNMQQ